MKNGTGKYDKKLAAVCGLFCPSCTLYIGTKEDPERLKFLAQTFKLPVEDVRCEGCRAKVRSFYCRDLCKMYKCATGKGLDFCGSCPDYPCQELKDFQCAMPHRIELWSSLESIREAGPEHGMPECWSIMPVPRAGRLTRPTI